MPENANNSIASAANVSKSVFLVGRFFETTAQLSIK